MKSILKHLGTVYAKSCSKALLFVILILFLTTMITIGAPGQVGLAFQGVEKVFNNDEIGYAMLNGQTFEDLVANDEFTDEYMSDFKWFLFKAFASLFAFIVFIYVAFVAAETVIWNLFHKQKLFKEFVLRLKLNLLNIFMGTTAVVAVLILYLGLLSLQTIKLLAPLVTTLLVMLTVISLLVLIHLFLATNLIALKKHSLKKIVKSYANLSWKRLVTLVCIYFGPVLLMLLLSLIGAGLNMQWPHLFGLLTVISFIIPLAWLRQLLYVDWKLRQ